MSSKKSTELRQRLGDPSKGKAPTARVQAPDFVAVKGLSSDPPEDLSESAIALWDSVVENASWLTETDRPGLVLLCRTHDKLEASFVADGELSPAATGLVKSYQVMLHDFGLTPRSRITLGLAVAETRSKLDIFKAGA